MQHYQLNIKDRKTNEIIKVLTIDNTNIIDLYTLKQLNKIDYNNEYIQIVENRE